MTEDWVGEAAALPVAFAQAREDSELDVALIGSSDPSPRILMVASGGCTVAACAASGKPRSLCVVDPNPAQIALARLKLRLLQATCREERLEILGHSPMSPKERAQRLQGHFQALRLPLSSIGPVAMLAERGPDHVGRYELVFAALRQELTPAADQLKAACLLDDVHAQAAAVEPRTMLGKTLDRAFDRVFSLPNLVAIFGAEATQNSAEPFARHFARRTRWAFSRFPARSNPYLHQMLLGEFPPDSIHPWMNAATRAEIPPVTWIQSTMQQALAELEPA
ncbi:MAG: BtaA family protein, partial [Planctomycetales bacterium]